MSDWKRYSRGLPLGGAGELDLSRARSSGEAWLERAFEARAQDGEPAPVAPASVRYAAAVGSTALVPNGPAAGVPLPYGRVWAEARSITVSAGSSVEVRLVSTQNGVRAIVSANEGATVTGGSVRFWVFDPVDQRWALGGVDETLPTGVRSVSTTDQFVAVGAK